MKLHNATYSLIFGVIITSFILASSTHAETKAPVLNIKTLSTMNEACVKYARKTGHHIAIAIYNESGVLLSFIQTENASPATGEVARWKGHSAAIYRIATVETAKWNVPTAPKIATVQGGVPIFTLTGIPLGGIGVSGAPSEFDENCGVIALQSVGLLSDKPG